MQEQNIMIPTLSFRSTGVLYYKTPFNHRARLAQSKAFQDNAAKLATRERYKGYVSPGAKKRMKKAITLLLQSTPYTYKWNPVIQKTVSHKISFITLTMPNSDKSKDNKYCQKNLLEPMLREFRRNYGMKSYIWKLELQENGNIHYHITTDFIISHNVLRKKWNKLLDRNKMLEGFKKEYGHDNPNSTDIHSVQNVRNLEAYLVKYICKETQNESKIGGKIWDCSLNLKQADYFKMEVDTKTALMIRELQKARQVVTQYFEKAIYFDFKTSDFYSFFQDGIQSEFFKHLNNIRQWVKSTPQQTNKSCKKLNRNTTTLARKLTDAVQLQIQHTIGIFGRSFQSSQTETFACHGLQGWEYSPKS